VRVNTDRQPVVWQHAKLCRACQVCLPVHCTLCCLPLRLQTLPPSFVRFLNKHGGKRVYV